MFEAAYSWISTQLVSNEVFAGLIGGSVFASLLYSLRAVPGYVLAILRHHFVCVVSVDNEDEAFDWIAQWLAETEYGKSARRLRLTSAWRDDAEEWFLSPGSGAHLLWAGWRPVLVERQRPDAPPGGGNRKRPETIEVRTIGRSPTELRRIIEEAHRLRTGGDKIEVFMFNGYWRRVSRRLPRTLDSVVLRDGLAESLARDTERFFASEAWYAERGIPYRRGYLLSGPPGCGKTSLVFGLASHFRRPVYALNLGSIYGDSQLFEALAGVPARAILLIEDIDATNSSRPRRFAPPVDSPSVPAGGVDAAAGREEDGLTLSGLLNAIDGVGSADGRLLVMTTNHPEALDPALIRPGRADRHEHIGPLGAEESRCLFRRFFPDSEAAADVVALRASRVPIPAAELQAAFLLHSEDPHAAARHLSVTPAKDAAD